MERDNRWKDARTRGVRQDITILTGDLPSLNRFILKHPASHNSNLWFHIVSRLVEISSLDLMLWYHTGVEAPGANLTAVFLPQLPIDC